MYFAFFKQESEVYL